MWHLKQIKRNCDNPKVFIDIIKNKLIAEEKGYIDYNVLKENIFIMRGLLSFIDLKEVSSSSEQGNKNRLCTDESPNDFYQNH